MLCDTLWHSCPGLAIDQMSLFISHHPVLGGITFVTLLMRSLVPACYSYSIMGISECLTLWFPLLINHIGFQRGGWKFPELFHGETWLLWSGRFAKFGNFRAALATHFYFELLRPQKETNGHKKSCIMLSGDWKTNTFFIKKKKKSVRGKSRGNNQFLCWHKRVADGDNGGQEARQAGQPG